MRPPRVPKPNLAYAGRLAKAGWDGVATAPGDPRLALRVAVWAPLVTGAGIGVLGACLGRKRGSARHVAIGGLLGSAVGLGGGMAWASRNYTGSMVRNVVRKVNVVRDAHWLEKNPITYA